MSGKDCSEGDANDFRGYETVFTNAKAGMDNVDKEKVKKIVFEMSKVIQHFPICHRLVPTHESMRSRKNV